MMKKCIIFLFVLIILFTPKLQAGTFKSKYLIIVADWGSSGPPADIVDLVKKNPGLKLGLVCSLNLKPSLGVAELAASGRIEPILALTNEPVFPLFYSTDISSSVPFEMNWPEDIVDVLYKAQNDFSKIWGFTSKSIYLRSGMFTKKLVPELKKFGIATVCIPEPANAPMGVYTVDGFHVMSARQDAYTSVKECFDLVNSNSGSVFLFSEPNALSAVFLAELLKKLNGNSDIEVMTPFSFAQNKTGKDLAAEMNIEPDLEPYLRNSEALVRLSGVRKDIESYKYSWVAKPSILDSIKDELYQIYHYSFLLRLIEGIKPEDEQFFQARIYNIYALMGRSVPDEIARTLQSSKSQVFNGSFSTIVSSDSVTFLNITDSNIKYGLENLSILMSDSDIAFSISISTKALASQVIADVYIDLNNRRGAGLAIPLDGVSLTLKPEDAWEFAIRFERNEASLYRSGRFKPTLVQKFILSKYFTVVIPKALLRGNPSQWGYQALLLTKARKSDNMLLEDLLRPTDDLSAAKLNEQSAYQAPFVRIKN